MDTGHSLSETLPSFSGLRCVGPSPFVPYFLLWWDSHHPHYSPRLVPFLRRNLGDRQSPTVPIPRPHSPVVVTVLSGLGDGSLSCRVVPGRSFVLAVLITSSRHSPFPVTPRAYRRPSYFTVNDSQIVQLKVYDQCGSSTPTPEPTTPERRSPEGWGPGQCLNYPP